MHDSDVSMAPMRQDWDIFCRVIDNFGDIGVCWRLARQLADEYGFRVRLWVDDLNCLQPLCPQIDCSREQQGFHGINIHAWHEEFPETEPGDVVIEAFACELPETFTQAMASRAKPPYWINLEYLTAESWATQWHGMVSPHPTLPLRKTFFFPGFTDQSGGLLRENGLFQQRDAFLAQPQAKKGLDISLFCYDNAPVSALFDALIAGPEWVRCHVPPGKPGKAVEKCLGTAEAQRIGNLEICPFPFLPQAQYDELLWRCDINFVRGEDSFVRAQWAGKPFVWQIYPQDEAAHWPKLEAFIGAYCTDLPEVTAHAFKEVQHAWNNGHGVSEAWQTFLAQRLAQGEAAKNWSNKLKKQSDLASRLVKITSEPV